MLRAYGWRALILGLLWACQAGASEHVVSIDFGARLSTLVMPQTGAAVVQPVLVFPTQHSPSTKGADESVYAAWRKLSQYLKSKPKTGSWKASGANNKLLAGHIRKNMAAVDWLSLTYGDVPVIYIGENHLDKAVKLELAGSVKKLKNQITHIAFEALKASRQANLDRYFASSDANEIAALEEGFLEDFKKWGYLPEHYLAVIQAAKDAGIRILALSSDEPKADRWGCSINDKECSSSDCDMSMRLASAVSKGSKILVLAGYSHVLKERQPRHLMERYGIQSKSYLFVSPQKYDYADWNEALYGLSREASRQNSFYFGLNKNLTGYDGFIYVPEGL